MAVTPHSAVLRPISSRSISSPCLRSESRVESRDEPTISRSEVWATRLIARAVVGDLQRRALGVVDLPEHHGVHVHRHGVLGERLFGVELGGLDALVEPVDHLVDDRHDHEQAGAGDRSAAGPAAAPPRAPSGWPSSATRGSGRRSAPARRPARRGRRSRCRAPSSTASAARPNRITAIRPAVGLPPRARCPGRFIVKPGMLMWSSPSRRRAPRYVGTAPAGRRPGRRRRPGSGAPACRSRCRGPWPCMAGGGSATKLPRPRTRVTAPSRSSSS